MIDLNGIFTGVLVALSAAVVFLYRMWRRAKDSERDIRQKLEEARARSRLELDAQKEATEERRLTEDAVRTTEQQVKSGATGHFESHK